MTYMVADQCGEYVVVVVVLVTNYGQLLMINGGQRRARRVSVVGVNLMLGAPSSKRRLSEARAFLYPS